MTAAFRKIAPWALFAVFPVAFLLLAAIVAVQHGSLGVDFRGELYPEAKLVVHGADPFPSSTSDLSGGVNMVFPIPAALAVSPLLLLGPGAAAAVFGLLLVFALALALWLLGVDDWRVYGVVALWPTTLSALQTENLTVLLCLCLALMWGFRDRGVLCGIAAGAAVALKLFLWPILIWFIATRRWRSLITAAGVALVGTLLVLPFESLTAYEKLVAKMAETFAGGSYNIEGLLLQAQLTSFHTSRLVAFGLGIAVCAVAYQCRSLPLCVVAALVLSPIVWLHYLLLLVIPIALSRPRLAPIWFVPLLFWLCPGNGVNVRWWHTATALGVMSALAVATTTQRPDGKLGTDATGA